MKFGFIDYLLAVAALVTLTSFFLLSPLKFNGGCVTPVNELKITTDTTLCSGTYHINNTGTGVIQITDSNIKVTCNGTIIVSDNGQGVGFYVTPNNTNVTVENCEADGYGYGFEVYSLSDYLNVTFTNNTAHSDYEGFSFTRIVDSLITDNIADNSTDSGFFFYNANNSIIANNTSHDHQLAGTANGFYIHAVDNLTFLNNTAYNSSNGFKGWQGNITLVNNTAHDNSQNGFYFDTFSFSNFTNNTAYNTTQYGFYFSSFDNSTFTDNTAHDNINQGFSFNSHLNNLTVSNNLAYSNNGNGFWINVFDFSNFTNNIDYNSSGTFLSYGTNSTIMNNTIHNATNGLTIYYFNSSDIINNTIYNITSTGFYSSSSDYLNIINNTIFNTSSAIDIDTGSNAIISNNRINNTSGAGIQVETMLFVNVTGNIIYNGTYGIILKDIPNASVSNNQVYNSSSIGIALQDVDNSVVTNNIVNSTLEGYSVSNQYLNYSGTIFYSGIGGYNLTLLVPNDGFTGGKEPCIIYQDGQSCAYLDGTSNISVALNDLFTMGAGNLTALVIDENFNDCTDADVWWTSQLGAAPPCSFACTLYLANGSGNSYILNESCFNATVNVTRGLTYPPYINYGSIPTYGMIVVNSSRNNLIYNNIFNAVDIVDDNSGYGSDYFASLSPVTLDGVDYNGSLIGAVHTTFVYYTNNGLVANPIDYVTADDTQLNSWVVQGGHNFTMFVANFSDVDGSLQTVYFDTNGYSPLTCSDFENLLSGYLNPGDCKAFCDNILVSNGAGQNYTFNSTCLNDTFNITSGYSQLSLNYSNHSITKNMWNTTQQTGPNIIGGNDIGGNFYFDYNDIDSNGDGIGDTSYDIKDLLGVVVTEDFLPLTNNINIPDIVLNSISSPSTTGLEETNITLDVSYDGLDSPTINVSVNQSGVLLTTQQLTIHPGTNDYNITITPTITGNLTFDVVLNQDNSMLELNTSNNNRSFTMLVAIPTPTPSATPTPTPTPTPGSVGGPQIYPSATPPSPTPSATATASPTPQPPFGRGLSVNPTTNTSTFTLNITNNGNSTVNENVTENIPKSVAFNVSEIDFNPAPDVIIQADPVVAWTLTLAPKETKTISYSVKKVVNQSALNEFSAPTIVVATATPTLTPKVSATPTIVSTPTATPTPSLKIADYILLIVLLVLIVAGGIYFTRKRQPKS